jgi:MFS superfamily sulfate permease-like transporter
MVLDAAAIDDIDYTAGSMLTRVAGKLRDQHVRLIITSVAGPVREQLDRYGISAALGSGAFTTRRARR